MGKRKLTAQSREAGSQSAAAADAPPFLDPWSDPNYDTASSAKGSGTGSVSSLSSSSSSSSKAGTKVSGGPPDAAAADGSLDGLFSEGSEESEAGEAEAEETNVCAKTDSIVCLDTPPQTSNLEAEPKSKARRKGRKAGVFPAEPTAAGAASASKEIHAKTRQTADQEGWPLGPSRVEDLFQWPGWNANRLLDNSDEEPLAQKSIKTTRLQRLLPWLSLDFEIHEAYGGSGNGATTFHKQLAALQQMCRKKAASCGSTMCLGWVWSMECCCGTLLIEQPKRPVCFTLKWP